MAESTLIRVAVSRAKQLKALARARDTTMAGLVDEIVTRAILDGNIPDETPGLTLTLSSASDLEIRIGRERFTASLDEAETLFHWLGADTKSFKPKRKLGTFYRSLEVKKAGTAIILEIKRTGTSLARFSMTRGITNDVRRQIATAYRKSPWYSEHFKL